MHPFLDQIGFLTADDMVFLGEMFARFPRVKKGFETFAAIEPSARPDAAIDALKDEMRAGWARIGIPLDDVQNVFDHHEACQNLARFLKQSDKMVAMVGVHDITEAVVSDFTPFDDITTAEKKRLETLAIHLITEDKALYQGIFDLWMEYENCQTHDGQMAHDIDRLEMVMQSQLYETQYPHLTDKLQEFWTYSEKKLHTEVGRKFFNELRAAHPEPHPLKLISAQHPYFKPWGAAYGTSDAPFLFLAPNFG